MYAQFHSNGFFGAFPTQTVVDELIEHGVNFIVDLTTDSEQTRLQPYKSPVPVVRYSINDMSIPIDKGFAVLLTDIINRINKGSTVYIHCKGGHGRSGIAVAILIARLYNVGAMDAIAMTTHYHDSRTDLKLKWRKIGSPQTNLQRNYVIQFLMPLCFSRSITHGKHAFFVQKCLDPDDLYTTYKKLYDSNPVFAAALMNTGFSAMYYVTKDTVLGVDRFGNGENRVGVVLEKIRDENYLLSCLT